MNRRNFIKKTGLLSLLPLVPLISADQNRQFQPSLYDCRGKTLSDPEFSFGVWNGNVGGHISDLTFVCTGRSGLVSGSNKSEYDEYTMCNGNRLLVVQSFEEGRLEPWLADKKGLFVVGVNYNYRDGYPYGSKFWQIPIIGYKVWREENTRFKFKMEFCYY